MSIQTRFVDDTDGSGLTVTIAPGGSAVRIRADGPADDAVAVDLDGATARAVMDAIAEAIQNLEVEA